MQDSRPGQPSSDGVKEGGLQERDQQGESKELPTILRVSVLRFRVELVMGTWEVIK